MANKYNPVAPIVVPKSKNINPSHLPNINPARIAIGDKKPAAKTQKITNTINTVAKKNKFDCLSSKK